MMKEKTPKDLMGIMGLDVQAKKATDEVNDVTSICTAAFLQA